MVFGAADPDRRGYQRLAEPLRDLQRETCAALRIDRERQRRAVLLDRTDAHHDRREARLQGLAHFGPGELFEKQCR